MLRKRWAEQADLKRCILHSRRRTACANRYAVSRRRRSRLLQAQWIGSQGCSIRHHRSGSPPTPRHLAPATETQRRWQHVLLGLLWLTGNPGFSRAAVALLAKRANGCAVPHERDMRLSTTTPTPEYEAVIDTVIVRQCSVLNFPASIRPHCAAGRIRGALSSASPSIGRIERVELVSASNKLVKLTVDFADRGCSVLAESHELHGPDPVYSLSDRDLGMFAVADIAPENPSAALPAHSIASTPTRADSSGNRRRTPGLALARLARRAPGQSLSTRHIFYPRAAKISAMSC